MGVVQLLSGQRQLASKEGDENQSFQESNDNRGSAEIIQLVVKKAVINQIDSPTAYKRIEAVLVSEGVDFSCSKNHQDWKIVISMVKAMLDRQNNVATSTGSILGDALRALYSSDIEDSLAETNELYGDLLGCLD